MKRIAQLIIALALLVGCSAAQAQPNSDVKHIGSVKLVAKSKLERVKTIALASKLDSLLVSDGTIIAKQAVDLEVLSLSDFKRTASFKITDSMSGGYPWASNSLAISRDDSAVLLYNQYVDLNNLQTIGALDIQPVVGRPNVCPEPWSISPNGKLALVCVGSYWSHEESTLATFDLKSGKSVKKIATGRNMEYGSACFLDNETVVSVSYDGRLTLHNLKDATAKTMSEKISQGSIQHGRNLRLQPFNNGKKLVITGDDEIFVVDVEQRKIIFRKPSAEGNAVLTKDSRYLLWQTARSNWKLKETDYLLMIANIQTGEILGEYILPTFYHMILVDDSSEFIYAARYNELHKLKIDLAPIKKK